MTRENDNKTTQKYKELIKEGKFNFVIKQGILCFGIPVSVLFYLFDFGFTFSADGIVWITMWALIGGTAMGLILWWSINKKLKKLKSK